MYSSRARNKDERAEEQKVMGQGAGPCKAAQKGFSEEVLLHDKTEHPCCFLGCVRYREAQVLLS